MKKTRLLIVATLVLAGAGWILLASMGRGHVIRAPWVPNHGRDFDFSDPPCSPAARPAEDPGAVLLRYLGAGGLYVEWRGSAILTAPFFSNPSVFDVAFDTVSPDRDAIRRGMQGIPTERIGAVLVGHSHYDHIADLPTLLDGTLSGVPIYVNQSGANMLSGCRSAGDLVVLEDHENRWIRPVDSEGRPLPIRFLPVPSAHAAHLPLYHYAPGEVSEAWTDCLNGKAFGRLKEGRTYAFLIDLLADDGRTVEFRIHYQDAVSSQPLGFPPPQVMARRKADLAVVCLASYWMVERYPEGILEHVRARHALVTHYEDFFTSIDAPLRFVRTLTDRRANRFMRRLEAEMSRPFHRPRGPSVRVCGPSGAAWTMPLPGEWIRF